MAAKSVSFRLFPGAGGGLLRQRPCPLRHGLRRATLSSLCRCATSPSGRRESFKVRGKGFPATFLAPTLGKTPPAGGGGTPVPEGERLSSGARLRGLVFPSAALPSPSRLAPCHLSRSERQGLFRRVLGSHFGGAVAVRRLRGLVFPSARLRGQVPAAFLADVPTLSDPRANKSPTGAFVAALCAAALFKPCLTLL